MLLTYRNDIFTIPHTSTCIIHTTGKIKDGDMITITSPVFASTNFTTRSVSMSDRFDVIVRVSDTTKVFVNDQEVKYVQDRATQNIILKLVSEEQ